MKSVTTLSPQTLRDLAAALEWNSPRAKARRDLSPESIDALAVMLLAGGRPTIGWWKKHRLTPVTDYVAVNAANLTSSANNSLPADQTLHYFETGASVTSAAGIPVFQ